MTEEKFYSLLNKTFELMTDNKLREDMDDTLLEKLLSVIKNESEIQNVQNSLSKIDFLEDLIHKANALHLVEKTVISLTDTKQLSTSVTVFSLRFMSLIFTREKLFISLKNLPFFDKLPEALKQMPIKHAPSIQDALLNCLFNIAQHSAGTLWIIEQNLLDFVFNSFSCTSYYVRKTAVNFFKDILPLWSSKFSSFSPQEQAILKEAMENILTQIADGVQLLWGITSASISDCCSSVLEECLKINELREIVRHTQLYIDVVHKGGYFMGDDKLSSNVSSLILSLFGCNEKLEGVMKGFIKRFVEDDQFLLALNLASSFLLKVDKYKPFSKEHIDGFLIPLYVLSGKELEEDILFFGDFDVHPFIVKEIENKSNCIKLVSSSLCLLSKMTSCMNVEALNAVADEIKIVVQGPTCKNHHRIAYVCLYNRSIILALLDLLKSMLSSAFGSLSPAEDSVYYKLSIFKYLLCFLDRPSFDTNALSEVLRLLKDILCLNENHSIGIPDDVKETFVEHLSRKILDNRESVVDNALLIGGQILSGKDNEVWQAVVLKHNIHMIIWEIAVEGRHEGFIKASALNVIIHACLVERYWEDIKRVKNVNEADVMNILYCYFHDPDYFVQRESVLCICTWITAKMSFLPASSKEIIFAVLSDASKSLDLELKLTALNQWQSCLNSGSYFLLTFACDMNIYLKSLCDSGFGLSLIAAVDDYDAAVKYKAACIMVELREKINQLGYTKESLPIPESYEEASVSQKLEESLIIEPISKEEKIVALDTVMNLSTAEQISNITRPSDVSSIHDLKNDCLSALKSESLVCSLESFWLCLWSDKLDCILNSDSSSTSMFSDYSMSLLEDIIASEETKVFHPEDETRDCY